ncbi:hypothetical protein FPANT_2435 [Fusarium pseudoanthophilum]|uniref:Uncharacterized protein n=1 Tax=Fusarium pseudoanthophilum TaxID=48495 RepID=A0A8H5PP09_9HYPO|nr:hypothetical protein FPANT_2435 [Fusarium pseudoanthophilum]
MDVKQDLPIFDHSAADFNEVGPRRVYMEQYFRVLGLWQEDHVEAVREATLQHTCLQLRENKYEKVGQPCFEYMTDYGLWHSLLGGANLSYDDHPWPHPVSAMPEKKDLSQGVSLLYQGWILRDKSLLESQGEPPNVTRPVASDNSTATPGPKTRPSVVAESSQESSAEAKNTVVRYNPLIPFALQAKRAAAANPARQSS